MPALDGLLHATALGRGEATQAMQGPAKQEGQAMPNGRRTQPALTIRRTEKGWMVELPAGGGSRRRLRWVFAEHDTAQRWLRMAAASLGAGASPPEPPAEDLLVPLPAAPARAVPRTRRVRKV